MRGEQEWKRLKLYEKDGRNEYTQDAGCLKDGKQRGYGKEPEEKEEQRNPSGKGLGVPEEQREHSSKYLIARDDLQEERRKELLYRVLGPVFFGKKEAQSWQELVELFRRRYGIDVEHDFFEGDEHYEEYMEAQQAIAEGMSIYSGSITFEDSILAEYAERLWEDLEQMDQGRFRRINTMLEE